MTRDLRIQYPGAIYHVTSRGDQRQDIFWNDADRGEFWKRIGQTVIRYRWEMFSAVLMTNHFHLFLRTLEANLSRGMQYLLGGYANWFNKRHQRIGHLFQGRFRGHIIEDEVYFWTVSRYVHLNPVPVIVRHPLDWPWSTYAGYVDAPRRWDWVAYDALLNAWQGDFGGQSASDRYRSFVEAGLQQQPGDPFAKAIDGWILGSQEFAERIRQQLQPAQRRTDPMRRQRMEMSHLLSAVCDFYRTTEEQLARRGSRHPARAVLALLAQRHTATTLDELAPLLGVARGGSVPYLIRRAANARQDSEIVNAIRQIEAQLRLD